MKKLYGVVLSAAVMFILVFPTVACAGPVQWPGFAYDRGRTGQSPYNGPTGNRLKWRFTISGWGSNVVIGADGTAYFGTRSGFLFAVDNNGVERWRFRIRHVKITPPREWPEAEKKEINALGYPVSINSTALGPDGTIYFGESIHVFTGSSTRGYSEPGYQRKLYALRPDKTVKFTFSAGEADIATHISVGEDGAIYFGTIKGDYKKGECRLYALHPNGQKKWETVLSHSGSLLSPAIGRDGVIYVGGDKLLALRTGDGSKIWEYDIQTTTSIAASPAVAPDGSILVCTRPTAVKDPFKLFTIHPDGSLKWSLAVGSMETSPAIAGDGTIYITSWTPERLSVSIHPST
ncbi:MAG: PQQ-like beta-propeller repeat protein, partial [Desulfobacterales bacterium]|nr:PQQ-like beta-propeller repeat protein [Desulfobacterales bacterium]